MGQRPSYCMMLETALRCVARRRCPEPDYTVHTVSNGTRIEQRYLCHRSGADAGRYRLQLAAAATYNLITRITLGALATRRK